MAEKNKYFKDLTEFKEKIQFNEHLKLDDRDNIILSMLQKDPGTSQEEISKRIKLSQPSVGARIRRLHQKGILHNLNGVNFKVADLQLAKVDINAKDTNAIIQEFIDCPFFINALVLSGRYNLSIFFMATNLIRLEAIVNHHLRKNSLVKEIEMNIVISSAKDLVLPMNIDYENKKQLSCKQDCLECDF